MRYLTSEDSMAIKEGTPLGMCKQAGVPDKVYGGLRTTSHTKRHKYALLARKAYPLLDAEESRMRNVAGFAVPVRGPVSFTHVTGAFLLPTFTSRAVPLLIGSTKVVFVLRAHLGQKMDIESVPMQVLEEIKNPSDEDCDAALEWTAEIYHWAKYLGEAHYDPPNIASMIDMGVAIQVELSVTAAISAGLSTFEAFQAFQMLASNLKKHPRWISAYGTLVRPQLLSTISRMSPELQHQWSKLLDLFDLGVMHAIERASGFTWHSLQHRTIQDGA